MAGRGAGRRNAAWSMHSVGADARVRESFYSGSEKLFDLWCASAAPAIFEISNFQRGAATHHRHDDNIAHVVTVMMKRRPRRAARLATRRRRNQQLTFHIK